MDIYTNIGVVLLNRMLSEGSVGGIGGLSLTPIDTLHQLVFVFLRSGVWAVRVQAQGSVQNHSAAH